MKYNVTQPSEILLHNRNVVVVCSTTVGQRNKVNGFFSVTLRSGGIHVAQPNLFFVVGNALFRLTDKLLEW